MSNKRFGIKEVADVTFYELSEHGYPGNPVICLDTLKVSNIEQTADQTDARGGKGSSPLIIWDHNKEITLTLQDAVLSNKTLEIMYGDQKSGVVTISASTFPKTYYVEGSTFARDLKTGKDQIFKFIIPKAKVVSENTITMEAEGDPTVFDIKLRALRDTDGNMLRLVLVPEDSKGLVYEECEGGYKVIGIGTCEDTDVVIPNFYNEKPVVAIGAEAFMDSSMTSVTIPSNVVEIEIDAFNSCLALETVNMSEGLKIIGDFAFVGCSALRQVDIPNSVTTIDEYAFASCENLKTLTLRSGVVTVDTGAFSDVPSLSTVYYNGTLAQSAKMSIAQENDKLLNARTYFSDITAEQWGVGGGSSFAVNGECLIISGIGKMKDYENYMSPPWAGIPKTKVIIDNEVTYIGQDALVLTNAETLVIGSSVASIHPLAISLNTKLKEIVVVDANQTYTVLNGDLYNKDLTTLVLHPQGAYAQPIHDGTITIGERAFAGCYFVYGVTIPDTVITIEKGAFCDTGASRYTIPASVTTIGESAFYNAPPNVHLYIAGPENSIAGAPWGATEITWNYTKE